MTRADIVREIQLRLGEDATSPREPYLLDRAVISATNWVAQQTDCYQTTYTLSVDGDPTDMTAFCIPGDLYKIKSVLVTLSDATLRLLTPENGGIVTRSFMDKRYPDWRIDPESGDPSFFVLERPVAYLYPFPDYDAASGIVLAGFAQPGEQWTNAAASDADECPLPSYAHQSVVLRGCVIRIGQFPTKDNLTRLPLIERELRDEFGTVAQRAAEEYSGGSF